MCRLCSRTRLLVIVPGCEEPGRKGVTEELTNYTFLAHNELPDFV